MVINNSPMGVNKKKLPPDFAFTVGGDEYTLEDIQAATGGILTGIAAYAQSAPLSDGSINWELALLTSGSLKFNRVVDKVDVFIVNSGTGGNTAYIVESTARNYGGKGGNGGKTYTHFGVPVSSGTDYAITVGAGGMSSQASSAFGLDASNGTRSSGASGAIVVQGQNISAGWDAGVAVKGKMAFGPTHTDDDSVTTLLWNGYRYGAGGGGGAAKDGSSPYYAKPASNGGTSGGGKGGDPGYAGRNASDNSGSGGGGGGYYAGAGVGGNGGSGIIIIRNAR